MKRSKTCNIIYSPLKELSENGYKPIPLCGNKDKTTVVLEGDLLCGANTSKDLWIELDKTSAQSLQKTAQNFVIVRKS